MFQRALLFFIFIALTGCTLLSPVSNQVSTDYVLNTVPTVKKATPNSLTLLVTAPQASAVYNSRQMLYVAEPYQLAYFAKSRWADTPANMLQSLIIQTLQNTQHFHAVISAAGHYDRVLTTELIKLQQNFLQHPSRIELVLRVQLVDAATSQVIAAKQISVAENASTDTPYSGVIAANKAVAKALSQIASFVTTKDNK